VASNPDVNHFEIHTANAVAGVRGTELTTGFDVPRQQTTVGVHEGRVEFYNKATPMVKQVLTENQISVAIGDKSPTPPRTMTEGEKKSSKESTEPKKKEEDKKEDKKEDKGKDDKGFDKGSGKSDDKGGDKKGEGDKGKGDSDKGKDEGDKGKGDSDKGKGEGDKGKGDSDKGKGEGDKGKSEGDKGKVEGDKGKSGEGADNAQGKPESGKPAGDTGKPGGDASKTGGDAGGLTMGKTGGAGIISSMESAGMTNAGPVTGSNLNMNVDTGIMPSTGNLSGIVSTIAPPVTQLRPDIFTTTTITTNTTTTAIIPPPVILVATTNTTTTVLNNLPVAVIDTVPPELKINSGPNSMTKENAASFSFSANEAVTYYYRLGSGDWIQIAGNALGLSGLSEGAHTIEIRAVDVAGNATTQSYSWTTNYTAPTITLSGVPDNVTTNRTASFGVTGGGQYAYKLDGSTVSSGNLSGLSEGSHTMDVTATDAAGNSSTRTHNWFVGDSASAVDSALYYYTGANGGSLFGDAGQASLNATLGATTLWDATTSAPASLLLSGAYLPNNNAAQNIWQAVVAGGNSNDSQHLTASGGAWRGFVSGASANGIAGAYVYGMYVDPSNNLGLFRGALSGSAVAGAGGLSMTGTAAAMKVDKNVAFGTSYDSLHHTISYGFFDLTSGAFTPFIGSSPVGNIGQLPTIVFGNNTYYVNVSGTIKIYTFNIVSGSSSQLVTSDGTIGLSGVDLSGRLIATTYTCTANCIIYVNAVNTSTAAITTLPSFTLTNMAGSSYSSYVSGNTMYMVAQAVGGTKIYTMDIVGNTTASAPIAVYYKLIGIDSSGNLIGMYNIIAGSVTAHVGIINPINGVFTEKVTIGTLSSQPFTSTVNGNILYVAANDSSYYYTVYVYDLSTGVLLASYKSGSNMFYFAKASSLGGTYLNAGNFYSEGTTTLGLISGAGMGGGNLMSLTPATLLTIKNDETWLTSVYGYDFGVWSMKSTGAYSGAMSDNWAASIDYLNTQNSPSYIIGHEFTGTKWSNNTITGTNVGYWADIKETSPAYPITGSGGNITSLTMKDVVFLAAAGGQKPQLWATGNVYGATNGGSPLNQSINLAGGGITAQFLMNTWNATADINYSRWKWLATITGSGTVNGSAVTIRGAGAGTIDTGNNIFSGTAAGVVK
jgi:hypothetical protein